MPSPDSNPAPIAVSVIIPTYNRAHCLPRALAGLAAMQVPPRLNWEIIVVDNNSTDSTRAVVESFAASSGLDLTYVFEPQPGSSRARNAGVARARGGILAFTDDDARVSPNWLAEIARAFENPACMGAGGRCVPDWSGVQRPAWLVTQGPDFVAAGILLDLNLGAEVMPTQVAPWGLNMAFRRAAFERYGGFRTDLGIFGGVRLLDEDTEFGKRLIRAGETVLYLPRAVVYHPVQPQRLSKKYFATHFFNEGGMEVRAAGWPAGTVLVLGIPRYMFRVLAHHGVRALASPRPERRFFHRMQMHKGLGAIAEARRGQAGAPATALPPRVGQALKRQGN